MIKPRRMLVDQKSYDLAEHFMSDLGASKDAIQDLAEDIQRACESACQEIERKRLQNACGFPSPI